MRTKNYLVYVLIYLPTFDEFVWVKCILPETNEWHLSSWMLGILSRFLLVLALFSGANLLLVSVSVGKFTTRWWQLKHFFHFHPDPWGNDAI